MKLLPENRIGKEQFLIEHNKLSPVNLQVTFALLTQFQEAKKPLLKDKDWSNKLRVPLISWLVALAPKGAGENKNPSPGKGAKNIYHDYLQTKF